jgi:carbon-monoxide dehydrogenase medium subunit
VISSFFLHKPSTLKEASDILATYPEEAKILAGGSELVLLLKMGLAKPAHVVDINSLPGLNRIHFDHNKKILRIGPLVTHRMLETASVVRERYPIFADLERQVANVRVRNVGTLVGNLCFAEPHADPATLLSAYRAQVRCYSNKGERIVSIEDFLIDYYETSLRADEILTEVEIPQLADNFDGTYRRFSPGERPAVSMALLVQWGECICLDARLYLGCVAPTPMRIREVERALIGQSSDEIAAAAWEAGKSAAASVEPTADVWGSTEYKRQIIRVFVSRSLEELCRRRIHE